MKNALKWLALSLLIAAASPGVALAGEDEGPAPHRQGTGIRGFLSDMGYLLDEYGISREEITLFIQLEKEEKEEKEENRAGKTSREGRPALGCEWCHYGTVSDCCIGAKCGICWGF